MHALHHDHPAPPPPHGHIRQRRLAGRLRPSLRCNCISLYASPRLCCAPMVITAPINVALPLSCAPPERGGGYPQAQHSRCLLRDQGGSFVAYGADGGGCSGLQRRHSHTGGALFYFFFHFITSRNASPVHAQRACCARCACFCLDSVYVS